MIYKLITWIEIYFVFYPTTLGGRKKVLDLREGGFFRFIRRRNKLIYI